MAQQPVKRWQFWAELSFFVGVLLTLCWGIWQTNQMVHDRAALPVRKIKIGGELRYVDSQVVKRAFTDAGPLPGLAAVDVGSLQEKLMNVPWVKWAAVRKSWPDQLDVYLIEHQPVATWRNEGLIDSEATLFYVPEPSVVGALPNVDSPKAMVPDALQMLRQMKSVLGTTDERITAIRVTERKAWQVTLNDALELRFGRKDTLQRLTRFRQIYPQVLATGKGQPAYMDFRYDTGTAVFWPEKVEPQVDG